MFSGGLRLRRSAQTRRGAVFSWTALFVLSIGLQSMAFGAPGASFAASLNVNLDQWANGSPPPTGESWQNGNLNGNNSAYAEGKVVPFRLAIEGLDPGTHTIHINHDFTAGGHKAYDFLATWDETETGVDPCAAGGGGVSSLCPSLGAADTHPFPVDTFAGAPGKTVAGAVADAGVETNLTMYGGTIESIGEVVHAGPLDGNSTTDMVVTFTVPADTTGAAFFLWGGHLALSSYWDDNPNGAGQISGAPWHMRTQNLDGSGNKNQDRSIQPSALVVTVGDLLITKDVTPATGFPGGTFDFTVDCGAAGSFTTSITIAAGGSTGTATISGITSGAQCSVSETSRPSAGTDWQWGTATITPVPVTITSGQTVPVFVTNPRTFIPRPVLTIDKVANTAGYDAAGDLLSYTITATNTGNVPLTNVTVSDPKLGTLSCTPAQPATLAVGASIACTGSYTTTQADVDAGKVDNTATADSAETAPVQDSASVPAVQSPALSITKVATEQTYDAVGDIIHYTIVATNTGNVTLTNVSVTDPKVSGLSCSPTTPVASLAPGASITCTATHTIVQADLDLGSFLNTACVDDGAGGATKACADETVTGEKKPALSITKVATEQTYDAVGDIIHYTIVATNTGNVTLANVVVSDDAVSGLSCTPALPVASLAPGATITCTATHTITQADLDVGTFLNTACVDDGEGGASKACASETVTGDQDPALTLVKSASPATYSTVGQTITYSYLVTNSGNVTLDGPVSVDDDKATVTCPATATLAVGASITCTATYTTTQADLDAGSVTNVAQAHASFEESPVDSNTDTETVTAVQSPALTLVKTASPQIYTAVGDVISYGYLVTNSGNVTLTGPFTVTDDKATATCPATATLAPLASITCAASYTITQADLNSGSVTNVAQAHAYFDGSKVDSNQDTETVTADQNTGLILVKSANPQTYDSVGDVISYSYLVTNNGNVSLEGPVTIADDKVTATCPAVTTVGNLDNFLDPRESITCTASHTITQADLDAGSITNVAMASAGGVNSNESQETVTAVKTPKLVILKVANTTSYDAPSDVLSYTITATNTGNITLTGVTISDPKLGVLLCTPAQPATLAPGAKLECTGTYSTTQADVDAGKVDNTATADSNETGPVTDDATVPAVQTPDLAVVKEVSLTEGSGYSGSVATTVNQTVYYRITVTNTGNVTLTGLTLVDSLADLAAKGCTIPASLAPAASFHCDYSMTAVVGVTVNTATADSSQTPEEEDTATVTVGAPVLTISKSVAGNTAGTEPLIPDDDGGPAPKAKVGDTLTFTLEYTLTNGPVRNATIVDVLPAGYGEPSDISDGGVKAFVAGAWQITWTWERLAASGTVSYKVVVLADANELAQPRVNEVTIDSADTAAAEDVQPVVIAGEEEGATATPKVTPPPTSTSTNPAGDGSGGMLLVLLAIAGLVAALGVLTPTPARARRRSRRG